MFKNSNLWECLSFLSFQEAIIFSRVLLGSVLYYDFSGISQKYKM